MDHDSTGIISESYDPKERRYRVLCVIIFIIGVIGTISSFAWMIQSFVGGFNIASSIVSFVIGLLGLLLLYNGLYGSHRRGVSLLVYVIVFEFLPAFVYTVFLLFLLFGFSAMKEAIEKELKKQDIHVGAGTVLGVMISLLFLFDAYHIFAGLVVNTYLKLRKQRDWSF